MKNFRKFFGIYPNFKICVVTVFPNFRFLLGLHPIQLGLPSKLLNPLKTALTAIEKDLRQLGKKLGFGLDDPDDEDRRQKLEARLRQEFLKLGFPH